MTGRRADPKRSLDTLRAYFEIADPLALVSECIGNRCVLQLDIPSVCISRDRSKLFPPASQPSKRPDFFLATVLPATGVFAWVIVEMTAGKSSKSSSEAHAQLQAAADAITHAALPAPADPRLLPVVLQRRDRRVSDLQQLGRPEFRVRFGGKKISATLGTCGDSLSRIIDSSQA